MKAKLKSHNARALDAIIAVSLRKLYAKMHAAKKMHSSKVVKPL